MSQYLSAMFRRRPNEGWFRVGRYDATGVDILCALAVASMFVWAASIEAFARLIFSAPLVREEFQVWRLFTWPIATEPNFFALLGLVFFWVFGQQLEGLFGRNRFMVWIITVALVPSTALTFLGALSDNLDFTSANFGLSTMFLCGIWVYAATYPNVRWFEIMPLWGLAAIFTGINLLSFTGTRAGGQILFMLFAIGAGLSMGRSLGLATAWPIPTSRSPGCPAGARRPARRDRPSRRRRAAPSPSGAAPASASSRGRGAVMPCRNRPPRRRA